MSGNAPSTLVGLFPGAVVNQGRALMARLRLAFPENRFQMRLLPPRIDKAAWRDLTQSGQPFLGLGFEGIESQKMEGRSFHGIAKWILLVAVRAAGTPISRYFGDAQGVGVMTLAPIAVGMLQGWVAVTGTVSVTRLANVASDEWADDSSILSISFTVPIILHLHHLIEAPPGLGQFEELAETWVIGESTGVNNTYSATWENPNEQG